mmetsp:Transcript_32654/g.60351  ORF Transcript_32654/g.60351 Transcript_32654/m.60351 type:complete len:142 (+) Transcript_32654:661-1086(+)
MMGGDSEEEEGSDEDKEDCRKENKNNDVESEEPLLSRPSNKNNGPKAQPDELITNAHDEDDGEEDHSQILLSQVSNIGHTGWRSGCTSRISISTSSHAGNDKGTLESIAKKEDRGRRRFGTVRISNPFCTQEKAKAEREVE